VCAEVVPSTIHHQVIRKPGLLSGPGELFADPGQMAAFRFGRKYPALSFAGTSGREQIEHTITHGNVPTRLRRLAFRVEDHPVLPINVFDSHLAYLRDVPHPRIAHGDENILERLS